MATHTYETFQKATSDLSHGRPGFLVKLGHVSARVFAQLYAWQTRVDQRAHLAGLDDRLLRDMGMTRDDARTEAGKPFWQV